MADEVLEEESREEPLDYEVSDWSSFSSAYHPRHILADRPGDQASRWSSASNNQQQFVTLRLARPALLTAVVFGKFHKVHVCNLREFRVFAGMTPEGMKEVLHSGLRNDAEKETFRIAGPGTRGPADPVPCRLIKIVPLAAWGVNFNFSIWHVALLGDPRPQSVARAARALATRRSAAANKLVLKHLRRHGLRDAFAALAQACPDVALEHPVLGRLYAALVDAGNYDEAEAVLERARADGLFREFVSRCPYTPSWTRLGAPAGHAGEAVMMDDDGDDDDDDDGGGGGDDDGHHHDSARGAGSRGSDSLAGPGSPEVAHSRSAASRSTGASSSAASSSLLSNTATLAPTVSPGMRGGHQMCIDSTAREIYLFGGWDGARDLDDLWLYSLTEERWRCVMEHTALRGGPSPRSCHKVCIDPLRRKIYTLGRYVEHDARSSGALAGDFFAFDMEAGTWETLSHDTEADGGPALIYDHQMCLDPASETIFVFGGRVLAGTTASESTLYSGLYAYDTRRRTWRLLAGDANPTPLRSRIGHSMLLHPELGRLYVFAGQRHKDYLSDFLTIDIRSLRAGGGGGGGGGGDAMDDGDAAGAGNAAVDAAGVDETQPPPSTQLLWSGEDSGSADIAANTANTRTTSTNTTNTTNASTSSPHALTVVEVSRDSSRDGGPDAGFTQRATIDVRRSEIYVFSGLMRDRAGAADTVKNQFWVYSIENDSWANVYQNNNISTGYWERMGAREPCPRFAHQLVYDAETGHHYLFGGNPGDNAPPGRARLDDFWRLELSRPSEAEIARRAVLAVRRQRYRELCRAGGGPGGDPLAPLAYLRGPVADVVDTSDPVERAEFEALAAALFGAPGDNSAPDADEMSAERNDLFETLSAYFPRGMTQPEGNLVDLVDV